MRPDVRMSPAAVIFRAKVVLTGIALVAAVVLIAVASWPLKLLVALVFARGLFASGMIARGASRHGRSRRMSSAASSEIPPDHAPGLHR